jgi:hypothetical protein
MESVEKTKWWQKKTVGIFFAILIQGLRAVPQIPVALIDIATVILGAFGVYGYTEIERAKAKAAQMLADK